MVDARRSGAVDLGRICASNWPGACCVARWTASAANGEIIAASQGYKTKASAEKGIESVKTTGAVLPRRGAIPPMLAA